MTTSSIASGGRGDDFHSHRSRGNNALRRNVRHGWRRFCGAHRDGKVPEADRTAADGGYRASTRRQPPCASPRVGGRAWHTGNGWVGASSFADARRGQTEAASGDGQEVVAVAVMSGSVLAVVAVTVVLIAIGVVLAVAVAKFGHRHEEQVFAVLADLRLHAAETELRERQALNRIDDNVRSARSDDGPVTRRRTLDK